MKKPLYVTSREESMLIHRSREYYERNNSLIQQYVYIDRLLDSSLPHDLIQEYQMIHSPSPPLDIPSTITEEPALNTSGNNSITALNSELSLTGSNGQHKVKRTPKNLYKVQNERTPLLSPPDEEDYEERTEDAEFTHQMPHWEPEEETDSGDRIVTIAIYINLAANSILLILKIIVTILTSSVSVLAALVDAILDFLSTAIVWTTTRLISAGDDYQYPIGRRRLEPIGVLVFSVIMITAFAQVAIEGTSRLTSADHKIVQLGPAAIAIMASTVVIKGLCWFWCRLVKNSSVQALAQDAVTDVVFNTFSIIFPLGKQFCLQYNANGSSWILRKPLVARSARRYFVVNIRHVCMVTHYNDSHPQSCWSSCHC
jgi:Cation efflux family